MLLGHRDDLPHGLEDLAGHRHVVVRGVGAGRDGRCPRVDEGRGVGHRPDDGLVLPEAELEALGGDAGEDAHHQHVALDVVADVGHDLGAALRLDREEDDRGLLYGRDVVGRRAQAVKLLGHLIEGRFGAARGNDVLGGDQFAFDHAADEGAPNVAGADDSNRFV